MKLYEKQSFIIERCLKCDYYIMKRLKIVFRRTPGVHTYLRIAKNVTRNNKRFAFLFKRHGFYFRNYH